MPRIFKENKFALIGANILVIFLWIIITQFISNFVIQENQPFYIYKLADFIKFIPPIWLTYYLWIVRRGFK